jgi:hypothetical protein
LGPVLKTNATPQTPATKLEENASDLSRSNLAPIEFCVMI